MSSQQEAEPETDNKTEAESEAESNSQNDATYQTTRQNIYGSAAPRRVPLPDPPEIDPNVELNYDPAFHDFLFLTDGSLPNGGQYEQVKAVRNHIDNMYDTDAVFSLKQVDTLDPAKSQHLTDALMEFAGAWQYHPYGNTRTQPVRRFVRADAADASSRGGFSLACQECNNELTIVEYVQEDQPSIHDGCDAVSRMELKTRLATEAEREIRRLYWRGWSKRQVRNRFGLTHPNPHDHAVPQDTIAASTLRHELDIDAKAMMDTHRYAAANTMLYLRVHHDKSLKSLCKLYGVRHETACQWVRNYTGIDSVLELNRSEVIVPHPPSARS